MMLNNEIFSVALIVDTGFYTQWNPGMSNENGQAKFLVTASTKKSFTFLLLEIIKLLSVSFSILLPLSEHTSAPTLVPIILSAIKITIIRMLYIINNKSIFVDNNEQIVMRTKKIILLPKHKKIFEQVGENIKLARLRRKLTASQAAERAGINRTTLYKIEKGNHAVSFGAYFNVLRVMGLQDDFLKLAADDEFGKKLQDLKLLGNK